MASINACAPGMRYRRIASPVTWAVLAHVVVRCRRCGGTLASLSPGRCPASGAFSEAARHMRRGLVAIAIGGMSCAGAERGAALEAAGLVAAFQDGVAPTAGYAGTRDTMLEEADATARHGGDKRLSISGDT